MQVVWVTRWDELAGLKPYWNALSRGVPFRSWAWLAAWWKYYGSQAAEDRRRLFALAVYDDQNQLVGLAPWYLDSPPGQGEVVRALGSDGVCSDYLSILSLPGCEDAVADGLARWLCADAVATGWNLWNVLRLGIVDSGDAVAGRFMERMRAHGSLVYVRPGPSCWRIALPTSWDAYLATLSKSHRKQLRRLERRQFDDGRARLCSVADPTSLSRGLDILMHLHARRRDALGQTGAFADSRFASFHREAAAQLLAEHKLRLTWIELGGKPVAAEYQLVGNDVVYAYQSGIDPAALECEPGRMAMMATLRQAIDEGFRAFDLLRGDEPYKAHWRARPRASLDVTILTGRGADWLKYQTWAAGRRLGSWLRTGWRQVASLAHEN